MTARDAHAKNLANALDFSKRRQSVDLPAFTPRPKVARKNPSVALA